MCSDNEPLEISSDDEDISLPTKIPTPLQKKKQKLEDGPDVNKPMVDAKVKMEIVDVDVPCVSVTRELKVDELRTITAPPKYWDVPRPGKSFATVLDLSAKPEGSYVDKKGDILSIAQIFRAYVWFFYSPR